MNVIDVMEDPSDGKDRETRVLFADAGRRLTQLTLRRGSALATHASPDPVIIECVAGSGTLFSGGQDVALHRGRRVLMEAGEEHSIVAGAQLSIVLTRCAAAAPPGRDPSPASDSSKPARWRDASST